MTNLQRLLSFLSEPDYATKSRVAQNSNTCVMCKKKAKEFSTELAKFEYNVSTLCERCQETYIYNADEHYPHN
jgi:hypothetical protein